MNNQIIIHYHSTKHVSATLSFNLNGQSDNLFISYVPDSSANFVNGKRARFQRVKAEIVTSQSDDWSNYLTHEQTSILNFTYGVIFAINRCFSYLKNATGEIGSYQKYLNMLNVEINELKNKLPEISKDDINKIIQAILNNIPNKIRSIGLLEKKFNSQFNIYYVTSPSNEKLNNLWINIIELLSHMKNKGVVKSPDSNRFMKNPLSEEAIEIADINYGFFFGLNYKSFLYVSNHYTFEATYYKAFSLRHNCVGYVREILDRLGAGAFVSLKEISKFGNITTGYSIPDNIIKYSTLVNDIIHQLNKRVYAILKKQAITQTKLLDFIKDKNYHYTSYLYALKNKPDLYKNIDRDLKIEIDKYNLFPSHISMKDSMKILIKLINMIENRDNLKIFAYYLLAEINRTQILISYSEEDYTSYNYNETVSYVINTIKSSYINKSFGIFSNKASLPLAKWVCQRLLQKDIKSEKDILGILSVIILKSQGIDFRTQQNNIFKVNFAEKLYVETLISDYDKKYCKYTAGIIFYKDLGNNIYKNTNKSTRFISILATLHDKICHERCLIDFNNLNNI